MDYLNNFESEDILWNSSQEMNPKRYLFENKEEAQWRKLYKIKKREIYPQG